MRTKKKKGLILLPISFIHSFVHHSFNFDTPASRFDTCTRILYTYFSFVDAIHNELATSPALLFLYIRQVCRLVYSLVFLPFDIAVRRGSRPRLNQGRQEATGRNAVLQVVFLADCVLQQGLLLGLQGPETHL